MAASSETPRSFMSNITELKELALTQDDVGKKLFPGGVYSQSCIMSTNVFFGMIRLGGTARLFPVYDTLTETFINSTHYEFERNFFNFLKTNCIDLMNTAFMFDLEKKITTDSLGDISSSLYTTTETSGNFESSYLCFLLTKNTSNIPILVSTGVLVITKNYFGHFGHLWNFATNPLYSGCGYGTYFINLIKRDLKTISGKQLRLVVSNSNYPFMSFEERLLFYVKKGFSIASQNLTKPNIKMYSSDNDQIKITRINPYDDTKCTLIGVNKDGTTISGVMSYTDLKNKYLISVIDKSKQLIGISIIDSVPSIITPPMYLPDRSYSKPPDMLYSCLFHGEIMSKSLTDGTIETFTVPENVELIIVNQIGSNLYASQWRLFLTMYNNFNMSDIPIEILQYIFPKIHTTNKTYKDELARPEILVPTLVKDRQRQQNIQITKQFSSSLLLKGNSGDVTGNALTARVYRPGDICPEMNLSMKIHTKAGKYSTIYDCALRGGGLRVSSNHKTMYVPPENYLDPSNFLSKDRVFPNKKTIEDYIDTSVSGAEIKPGFFVRSITKLSDMIEKAKEDSAESDDDDKILIRIVVGCCAAMDSNYSTELLEYFRNAMIIPGYNSIKEVGYSSLDDLEKRIHGIGEIINLFNKSVTSGELLRMFESSSSSSSLETKNIILTRLFNLLNQYNLTMDGKVAANTTCPSSSSSSSSSSYAAASSSIMGRTRRKKKSSKRKTFKSKRCKSK